MGMEEKTSLLKLFEQKRTCDGNATHFHDNTALTFLKQTVIMSAFHKRKTFDRTEVEMRFNIKSVCLSSIKVP